MSWVIVFEHMKAFIKSGSVAAFILISWSVLSTTAIASEDREAPLENAETHLLFDKMSAEKVREGSNDEYQIDLNFSGTVAPLEIFNRTQAVLNHLGVPAEPSYQSEIQDFDGRQTESAMNAVIATLDPRGQFKNFAAVESGKSDVLHGFQDINSKQVEDFAIRLGQSPSLDGPLSHFSAPAKKPLLGLRIALDPGHMGGTLWDKRTGKYVRDDDGNTVSEGVINLQTSILLKKRLEDAGATVMVTHETLGPVETTITWETLDLDTFALEKIRSETLQSWFVSLVKSAPAGSALFGAFDHSSAIKKTHSDIMRWEYFVLRADLDARIKLIEQFKPHMTVIIHYDTSDPPNNDTGVQTHHHDFTKVYVPGGYSAGEFATRQQRKNFAMHAVDPYAWDVSLKLSKSILESMKKGLSLRGDQGADGSTVVLEPGLQARNLHLNGALTRMAVSYVECLYYNDPTEFAAFLKKDYPMTLGTQQTYYSKRLVQVADALEQGILNFAANLR